MREIVFRSERVELSSAAHDEAKAIAQRVVAVVSRQGRKASLRWADEYNDTSTRGTYVVMAED